MTDYQAGRAAAVFLAGTKVENLGETYEKETQNLESMKVAFSMATHCLVEYRQAMQRDLDEARVTIKEAEYGKVYVNRCIDLMKQLHQDAETKRLQAIGATVAMKQAVDSIKRLYDEENVKLQAHREYEKQDPKDPKDRPIGSDPEQPLESYKEASKNRRSRKATTPDR